MKIGVIGCGYWGPNLLRNLFATGRCQTICGYDAAPQRLEKVLARAPYVVPCRSVDEMMDCCDAIMVATPVKSHYALARRAIEAGKAVFVEKPLTSSLREACELTRFAATRQMPLMVGHTFLYSPPVRKVRQYIADGTLGRIYSVSCSRVNLGIHRHDVNVIWDLAPHDLSMLLFWLQEAPVRVSAIGRACVGRNVDVASLHLEFASGIVATIEVSWLAPVKLRRTILVGSDKSVVYDDTSGNEKIKLCHSSANIAEAPSSFGEYQLSYRNGDLVCPYLESTEPLLAQTNAFLDWLEHGTEPVGHTWIALQVVAAAEAACRSLQQDGAPMEVKSSGLDDHAFLFTDSAVAE